MMLRLSKNEERIVAVLHDVVEDCGVPLESLRKEGFSQAVIDAVDSVTHPKDEPYEAYIRRVASNPIG
jgi:(p)ppGpp synthase/HD superfamily hydrolase